MVLKSDYTHFAYCVCKYLSVMVATDEGSIRYWPSLAHESSFTETVTEFGGALCRFLTAIKVNQKC